MPQLSTAARLGLGVGLPSLFLITAWQSPLKAACLPLILAPTALTAYVRSRAPQQHRGSTETCLWSWAFSSTIGVGTMIALQVALGYSVAYLFHGEKMHEFMADWINPEMIGTSEERLLRASQAWTWPVVIQRFLLTFGGAGIFEELLKYAPLYVTNERGFACVFYAIFAGLGFGFFESYAAMQGDIGKTFVARVLLGATGHVLSAALSGLRAMGAQRSIWSIIGPSVFYHGVWNFSLLSLSETQGNIGWVEPTDTATLTKMVAIISGVWITCGTHVWYQYTTTQY